MDATPDLMDLESGDVAGVYRKADDMPALAVTCVPVAGDLGGVLFVEDRVEDGLTRKAGRKTSKAGDFDQS